MRIGVLTFHRAYNCGAMLQAWALQTVLERMGHQVFFPDANSVGVRFFWPKLRRPGLVGKIRNLLGWCYLQFNTRFIFAKQHWFFFRFCRKALHCSEGSRLTTDRCDLVIVGSDQVWSPKCAGEKNLPVFMGEGVDPSIPIIGYALSCGDYTIEKAWLGRIIAAAKERFRAVSYREVFLRDQIGVDGPVVCDPTLFLRREDYQLIECKRRIVKEPYIFVYAVSDSKQVIPIAKRLADKLGIRLFVADVYRELDTSAEIQNNDEALTPDKLLTHIRDAEYVIVSSFHGCVLSILYHKKFVCLFGEGGRVPSGRQQSLLALAGVSDRRFSCDDDIAKVAAKLQMEYVVAKDLSKRATASLSWLKSTIEKQ